MHHRFVAMHRRVLRCALVVLLASSAGACRQLAGYAETANIGPADLHPPPSDAPPRPPDSDAPPPPTDGSPTVDKAPDQGPPVLDQGPPSDQGSPSPDQGPPLPDLTSIDDAGVCTEPLLVLSTSPCETQRQGCTTGAPPDQDCDGLLDLLDVQQTGCNPLEFANEGTVALPSTTSNGCTMRIEGLTANAGSARPDQRIWVMRFYTPSLLPFAGAGQEKIVFAAQAVPTPNYRSCGIEEGATAGTIRLHLVADYDGRKLTAYSSKQIAPRPAGDYELVVTADGGSHQCQFYDGHGKLLLNAFGAGGPVMNSQNYSITISALGVTRVDVDYVRVFGLRP